MKLLIVVDMQNDFVTGSLGSPEAAAILPNVRAKIEQYIANGDRVIFTRDTHFDDYLNTNEGRHLPVPHCIKGTDGWQVVSELDRADCKHIDKTQFGFPSWDAIGIKHYDSVELVGVCTDICVVSNALIIKALAPELDVSVDARCCAGVTPEAHKAALQTMKSCQINVTGE